MAEEQSKTGNGTSSNGLDEASSVQPQPTLTTERLILRPFADSDSDVVQELLQCREIAANTRSIEHPYPEGSARIWIETHSQKWKTGASVIFAICMKDAQDDGSDCEGTSGLVGAIGLEINPEDENAELGYWVGKPFWGAGFCSEAAAAVLTFGFSKIGLHKIHAHHLAHNQASGRVMEKAGMEKEGYLKGHMKKWGVFEDVVFYGILASQWNKVPASL